jgi:Sec-independent protein translocase protein TatA
MVDLLFNIINVILLFVIGYLLFTTYLLPSLRKTLIDEKKYHHKMHTQKDELKQERDRVYRETKDQDVWCMSLQEKVELWKKQVDQDHKDRQDVYKKYQQNVHNRIEVQSKNYTESVVARASCAYVKQYMHKDLENYFENEDHVQKYFNRMTTLLNKDH